MKIEFMYTALQVSDVDKAREFYADILGMKQIARKMAKETDGELCILKLGDAGLELNRYAGQKR